MSKKKKQVLFTKGASAWLKWIAIVMVILSHYAEWWEWFTVEEGTRLAIPKSVTALFNNGEILSAIPANKLSLGSE